MNAPPYNEVGLFLAAKVMTQGITAVNAQAVIKRCERIAQGPNHLIVPWGAPNQQAIQHEVDEFWQCTVALSAAPELHALYDW
jgi:hypothetical protein